jgi:hypothetical protein
MNVIRIILIGGLLAIVGATSAGPAAANTLLSGYGGPGQGNQAILGSALVGKAKLPGRSRERGSGGGPGAASGASASAASGSSAPAPTGTGSPKRSAPAGTAGTNGAGAEASRRQSPPAPRRAANAAPGAAGAQARAHGPETVSDLYPASERLPAGQSSDALGVSGSELLYIILAFAALAIAAVLTKGLARADSAGRRS